MTSSFARLSRTIILFLKSGCIRLPAKGIDGNGPTPLDMLINEAPPASRTQELSVNLEDSESEHEEVEIITAGPAE
jgi:hypothetical protein